MLFWPGVLIKAPLLSLIAAASPAVALTCGEDLVTIPDDTPWSERMCAQADRAVADLAKCGMPLKAPVTVSLAEDLGASCVGVFHCGEGQIELLNPESLATAKLDSGLFSELDTLTYFDSILFHELVHAAYDPTPCPFKFGCMATAEYLAYAFQIRSLSDEDRTNIGLEFTDQKKIAPDEINAMIALMAPSVFASKAWLHFEQHPEQCAFVEELAEGATYFDRAEQ